jgi:hypothetical protein
MKIPSVAGKFTGWIAFKWRAFRTRKHPKTLPIKAKRLCQCNGRGLIRTVHGNTTKVDLCPCILNQINPEMKKLLKPGECFQVAIIQNI